MADINLPHFFSSLQDINFYLPNLDDLITQTHVMRERLQYRWDKLILDWEEPKDEALESHLNSEKINRLKSLFKEAAITQESIEEWLESLNVSKMEELPQAKIIEAIKSLESLIRQQ